MLTAIAILLIFTILLFVKIIDITKDNKKPISIMPVQIDSTYVDTTWFNETRITVYHPTIAQTDNSPYQTADGSIIDPKNPQRWVAVSRKLLKEFPYGSKLYIECSSAPIINGEYTVHDTGCSSGVDILIANPDVCRLEGCWKGTIYSINKSNICDTLKKK